MSSVSSLRRAIERGVEENAGWAASGEEEQDDQRKKGGAVSRARAMQDHCSVVTGKVMGSTTRLEHKPCSRA